MCYFGRAISQGHDNKILKPVASFTNTKQLKLKLLTFKTLNEY